MNDDDDFENDFDREDPTPRWSESMQQIMMTLDANIEDLEETVRSPGVETLTSSKPTRRMRPFVINNYDEER